MRPIANKNHISNKKAASQVDIGPLIFELIDNNQHGQAIAYIKQALKLKTKDYQLLNLLAFCYLRSQQLPQAISAYQHALKFYPENIALLEGLSESQGLSGNLKEAINIGLQCLNLKAKAVAHMPALPLPSEHPSPLSSDKTRNIIAYTLFGGNPRYCETAILNVQQARVIFPAWTCRFYVDDSVPKAVITRLQQAGAQIHVMDEKIANSISPLMWRFLVLDDTEVDCFMIRDTDSLISFKEQAAVTDWLNSKKWFHAMRDFFTHHDLLLAGMWGGFRGVFQNTLASMQQFCSASDSVSTIDQQYLGRHIWPTVAQSLICHDSVFGFANSVSFPAHTPDHLGANFHVGSNFGDGLISSKAKADSERKTALWRIINEQNQEICRYSSPIIAQTWQAGIPLNYVQKIQSGQWKLEVLG